MRNLFRRDPARAPNPSTWLSRAKGNRLLVPRQMEPVQIARPSGLFGVLVPRS